MSEEVIGMSGGNMIRKQLYLTGNLNGKLKDWARAKRISESEIMREALAEYLEREKRRATPPEDNPVLKMKGIFAGDESCYAAGDDHDKIVYNGDAER